jgi:hypothetical protein
LATCRAVTATLRASAQRLADARGVIYAGHAGQGRLVKDDWRRVTEDFYVQVRYPGAKRWVAVAVAENRRLAASLAAGAYKNLANSRGRTPNGVRIISARELAVEGGADAVERAGRDIADDAAPG